MGRRRRPHWAYLDRCEALVLTALVLEWSFFLWATGALRPL